MGCHPHHSSLVYRNEEQMLLKIFCSMVKPSLFKGQIPILAPQVPTFAAGEILTHQHFFRIGPPHVSQKSQVLIQVVFTFNWETNTPLITGTLVGNLQCFAGEIVVNHQQNPSCHPNNSS